MTVATAAGAPRASRSGMVRPSPARATTAADPTPIPWYVRKRRWPKARHSSMASRAPEGRRGRGGEESRGTRRWYAAVPPRSVEGDRHARAVVVDHVDDRSAQAGPDRLPNAVGIGSRDAGHRSGQLGEEAGQLEVDDRAAVVADLDAQPSRGPGWWWSCVPAGPAPRVAGPAAWPAARAASPAARARSSAPRAAARASMIGAASSALRRPSATRRRTSSSGSRIAPFPIGRILSRRWGDRELSLRLGDVDLAAGERLEDRDRAGIPGTTSRRWHGRRWRRWTRRSGGRGRRGRRRGHPARAHVDVAGHGADGHLRGAVADDEGPPPTVAVAAVGVVAGQVARDGLDLDGQASAEHGELDVAGDGGDGVRVPSLRTFRSPRRRR